MAYSDFMGWSLFRHEDVVRVLEDPDTYSSASRHAAVPNGIDPPAHGRFRAALAPHFTDERRAALEPRSRQINRDPHVFDDADQLRLGRKTDQGLVWGRGIHVCLGAPLARLQMRVALKEMLARTHRFEIGGEARRSVYPSDGLAWFRLKLS